MVMRNEDDEGEKVGRTREKFGRKRENLREKEVGTFGNLQE